MLLDFPTIWQSRNTSGRLCISAEERTRCVLGSFWADSTRDESRLRSALHRARSDSKVQVQVLIEDDKAQDLYVGVKVFWRKGCLGVRTSTQTVYLGSCCRLGAMP